MVRIALNGLGRIGKTFLRALYADPQARKSLSVAVINLGPMDPASALYALTYDTIMGRYQGSVSLEGSTLVIEGDRIPLISSKEVPSWSTYGIEVVVDATGAYTTRERAQVHRDAGAQRVVITAPAQGEDVSIVMGVNEDTYDPSQHRIISLGSCTTNAVVPLLACINEYVRIAQGWMTTVHAYTNTQRLVDAVTDIKAARRERAAALNIVPTSTGAAEMLDKILPELSGKIDAMAVRVPVGTGSFIDLSLLLEREVGRQEVLKALRSAASGRMNGILSCVEDPLVSSDVRGDAHSSVVDIQLLQVQGKRLKICSWYDNEWGYSCRIIDFLRYHAQKMS